MFNEDTVFAYAVNRDGVPVYEFRAQHDDYCELPRETLEATGAEVNVRAESNYLVESAYEVETWDDLCPAWERFIEEYRWDEAVEVLKRFARIFYPLYSVIERTENVDQSSWVRMVAWAAPGAFGHDSEPVFVRATETLGALESWISELFQIAKGEVHAVEMNRLEFEFNPTKRLLDLEVSGCEYVESVHGNVMPEKAICNRWLMDTAESMLSGGLTLVSAEGECYESCICDAPVKRSPVRA